MHILETYKHIQNAANALVRPIGTYRYSMFARGEARGPIFLFDPNGAEIGHVYFYVDNGIQQLPPSSRDAGDIVSLHYWYSDFTTVIDMLRNEKDCLLVWIDGVNSRISTGI
jgi:hypothetical protein